LRTKNINPGAVKSLQRVILHAEADHSSPEGRLDSWKEIAIYLRRDIRTVQRWEKFEQLPVHRRVHHKLATIYAYKSELDAWWGRTESPTHAASRDDAPVRRPLLAIVPLRNLSGDPEQEYFSDGLTEEMIAQLSRINPQQLGVIARGSAMKYKNSSKGADQIGRELGADYILDGSVRRSNQRVRISVQLVSARDQTHIWTESYDRDLQDILELQSEVAHAAAQHIAITVSANQRTRFERASEVSPAAYESYLRGRFFWNKRREDGLRRAIQFFEKAVTSDLDYAPAYAGLADCYALLATVALAGMPPNEAMPKAKTAALKALELDSGLAEAHASLAYASLFYDWEWPAAENGFKRALDLNPGYATAHQWYADYLTTVGRPEDAIAELGRARELDPLSLVIPTALGQVHYCRRDYDRVIDECQRTLEMEPGFVIAYLNLGRAYVQKKKYARAIAELERARSLSGSSPSIMMALGHAFGIAGKRSQALEILDSLKKLARQRYVPALCFAAIYTGLRDPDQAFRLLAKARDERCEYLIFLPTNPWPTRSGAILDSLR
jgi:TolB-like protein